MSRTKRITVRLRGRSQDNLRTLRAHLPDLTDTDIVRLALLVLRRRAVRPGFTYHARDLIDSWADLHGRDE